MKRPLQCFFLSKLMAYINLLLIVIHPLTSMAPQSPSALPCTLTAALSSQSPCYCLSIPGQPPSCSPTLKSSFLRRSMTASSPSLKSISRLLFPGGWHPNLQHGIQGLSSSKLHLPVYLVTPSNTHVLCPPCFGLEFVTVPLNTMISHTSIPLCE